ncbi:MAG: phosphoribosylformylglycinamidine synthase [Halothiobacillaceae bacterium]
MLIIPGRAALSDFRTERLKARLCRICPDIRRVTTRYLHFVDSRRPLNDTERVRLDNLLSYGEPGAFDNDRGHELVVIPRPGTISPWSTKATDIASHCGLESIRRIERGIQYAIRIEGNPDADQLAALRAALHDRMTQVVIESPEEADALFRQDAPAMLNRIALGRDGRSALEAANRSLGLALSDDELDYLVEAYRQMDRDPTDTELMMFAQANSEHCRHKIFNARWIIDGEPREHSLFAMIRNTYHQAPEGILSAYKDNASVVEGPRAARFSADPDTACYGYETEPVHLLMKVETHNHPTAISPDPGAATGAGGEIRDEGATGRGGKPKAGLCGFSVSNLRIPGFEQLWERDHGKPDRIESALSIMLEGPIGAAAFNNEFGRPNIAGYFRTFELKVPGSDEIRGYHKPIMIAGGMGSIRDLHVEKNPIQDGDLLIVLGGPAMQIGLGGGAASSVDSGSSHAELDFASVQRANPEMQRRCQEVIDRCMTLGSDNPIVSIHDVGAGGLSNAFPELVDDAGLGGHFRLRAIPSDEPGMSPLAIWCNESQERYVLAIRPESLDRFRALCNRERAPFAVIGRATSQRQLIVEDDLFANRPVDMPMDTLLGKPPKMLRDVQRRAPTRRPLETERMRIDEALDRVLALPTVADKRFLITIGDRSVGGLVCRDQMVGPWQEPVADVAVTATGFCGFTGEAMAMGERAPIALIDAPASGRMAIGECLTNLAAAPIARIGDIRLSANWMAAAGHPGEDAALYETVQAVGMSLCPALGLAIPVGKDSLSMKTTWQDEAGAERAVVSPLSLIISGFAPVTDVRRTLTPLLAEGDTELLLVDLGSGRNRLGGSALAQVYREVGETVPDVDEPALLKAFFEVVGQLNEDGYLLAYHDRSDGGLITTLCEMAFASRRGLSIDISALGADTLASLFNEELGAVLQVRSRESESVRLRFREAGLEAQVHRIGKPTSDDRIVVRWEGKTLLDAARIDLQRRWSATSHQMQRLRDNPECADQEYDRILDGRDRGLAAAKASYDLSENVAAPFIATGARPRVAILREQGVNGQVEMAAAFDAAGFEAIDLHMSDIIEGRADLDAFRGLVACGGFSYGDVLGAGGGWAASILHNPRAFDAFSAFFENPDHFGLGVCNGCQMMSQLHPIIPGADHWPEFVRNRSEQFEARLSLVEVVESNSIFLSDMAGSRLPIVVAHGEGRTRYRQEGHLEQAAVCLRYVDGEGLGTETYPANPNGSQGGHTGFTTADGRFTIMMPHPERVWRKVQYSWAPHDWPEEGAWLRMFRNARRWVG